MARLEIIIHEDSRGRLPEIYNLIENVGAEVLKEEWHSIYNAYIVYDYEPFCSEGYDIHLIVIGSKNTLAYLDYLIDEDKKKREHLENCFNRPAVVMGVI